MRKLALSDDILMKIEKPARYIGGEVNAVVKDLQNVDIRFAMFFIAIISPKIGVGIPNPPDTSMICPVVYAASSLAKYATAPAISSGVAILLIGMCFKKNSWNSGVRLFDTASVAVIPGNTALQRMLSLAHCVAISLVR